MKGVEIFTREQFETALAKCCTFTPLGLMQHNYAYDVDFGNPYAVIRVYSSVAPNGQSRADGEDSIRAWLVTKTGKPVGGKTQSYVTRRPGWQGRLEKMLKDVANLGRWIQPCPKCQEIVALSVKKDKVYIFCPTDAKNRDNKNHTRHLPLIALDKATGEQLS